MDLFCPHCSQRVSVPDDKAGLVMSCPLCAKQFMAPSLAPPPAAPVPPSPAPATSVAVGEPPLTPAAAPEPAAPPPGDYSRSLTLHLRASWLAFIPLACMLLIFILSILPWHNYGDNLSSNLWGMSFAHHEGSGMQGLFIAYTLLMFPTGFLVLAAFVLDKIFMPPQIAPFSKWKNLLVGLLLAFTLVFLGIDYIHSHLAQGPNPIALAEKVAMRLHFLAMLASFGMFWLNHRKALNLPAPKLELHW